MQIGRGQRKIGVIDQRRGRDAVDATTFAAQPGRRREVGLGLVPRRVALRTPVTPLSVNRTQTAYVGSGGVLARDGGPAPTGLGQPVAQLVHPVAAEAEAAMVTIASTAGSVPQWSRFIVVPFRRPDPDSSSARVSAPEILRRP